MGMPCTNKAIIEIHPREGEVMTVGDLMKILSKANPKDPIIINTDREPYGWFEITDAAIMEEPVTGWHWTNVWLDAQYHQR